MWVWCLGNMERCGQYSATTSFSFLTQFSEKKNSLIAQGNKFFVYFSSADLLFNVPTNITNLNKNFNTFTI